MKVLLSAYHCNPEDGSEPGVGWEFAAAAARHNDVWLLTWERYRSPIERRLAGGAHPRLHPVYLGRPQPPRLQRTSYIRWQRAAAKRADELDRQVRFDVTHHVTLSTTYLPVGVQRLDRPNILGPLCGTPSPPLALWRWLGKRGIAEELVRVGITAAGRRLWGRRAAQRASILVVAYPQAGDRLGRRDALVEPHAYSRPAELGALLPTGWSTAVPPIELRRAVFCGRLLPWKGLRLGLEALARPKAARWRLDVYGAGPDEDRLRAAATRLGLADRVTFHGAVGRTEVLAAMNSADALLMPSLHEGSSLAVAEAVSLGCPVVCLDWGGPPTLVGADGGTMVSVRGDVAGGIADALDGLGDRRPPESRWSAERLPALLDDWYTAAVGAGSVR